MQRGLTQFAYTFVGTKLRFANVTELNSASNAYQQTGGNVLLDPGYAAENFDDPTAERYQLNASRVFKGLGRPFSSVSTDYEGQARDPNLPTIGPDECQ